MYLGLVENKNGVLKLTRSGFILILFMALPLLFYAFKLLTIHRK